MAREQRLIVWIAAFSVFAFLLYVLSGALAPFIAGMAVAYFLDPAADRLEKLGCSRGLAAGLIIGSFFLLTAGLLVLLFPLLQGQAAGLAAKVPALLDGLRLKAEPWLARLQADLTPEMAERLRAAAGDYAGGMVRWLGGALAKIWSGGAAFLQILSLIVITPVVSFYMLKDWDKIIVRIDGWLPRKAAPVIRKQAAEIDRIIAEFVRGQASVCLALAAFYAIGLALLGLQFGLLVGIGAGLISFIPYAGAAVGLLAGVGVALAQFQDWLPIALTAAVFMAGQALESWFLTPRLVGSQVGLHPVWIIFALLASGSLFGFTGVLLAVPGAAVIGVLARFGISKYQASALYSGGGEGI